MELSISNMGSSDMVGVLANIEEGNRWFCISDIPLVNDSFCVVLECFTLGYVSWLLFCRTKLCKLEFFRLNQGSDNIFGLLHILNYMAHIMA